MSGYADTSFLVSLYTPDINTPEASHLSARAMPLLLTAFGEFEFLNAIELRVFRKEITTTQAEASLRLFHDDLDAGSCLRRALPANAYERAVMLSRRHTRQLGTRGMDILHVAIALELGSELFFTFDQSQRRLAHASGLTVRPGR